MDKAMNEIYNSVIDLRWTIIILWAGSFLAQLINGTRIYGTLLSIEEELKKLNDRS